MIQQPIAVYDAWAAYDELTDKAELTEELAMSQSITLGFSSLSPLVGRLLNVSSGLLVGSSPEGGMALT